MAIPQHYINSVLDINPSTLKRMGIDTLLLDLDNTLLPRDEDDVPDNLHAWASTMHEEGFKICLLSNNWHERVERVASELGFELVSKAVKPLPFAYLTALKRVGSKARTTAMIGDQYFTDVLGGTFMGMTTIMVLPLSSHDLPHTLFLRHIEKFFMGDREPEATL